MDSDEREIYDFLSSYGEEWVNAKEICRRAGGKRRFNEDRLWALPVLDRMKGSQILESDMLRRYRIRVREGDEEAAPAATDLEQDPPEGDNPSAAGQTGAGPGQPTGPR
jgi:hypothetical protein